MGTLATLSGLNALLGFRLRRHNLNPNTPNTNNEKFIAALDLTETNRFSIAALRKETIRTFPTA